MKKKTERMEVGQFWWGTGGSLYQIDEVTPDGFARKVTIIIGNTVGAQLQYSISPDHGWSSAAFDHLDHFRTEVYKSRQKSDKNDI